MNPLITEEKVRDYINEMSTKNLNIHSFLLSKSPFPGISIQELAQQIIGRKIAKNKLPTWFENHTIVYPKKLNLEQTSSEITAAYKSKLVDGNTLVDITGGFGVDDYYFAKKINTVVHCELQKEVSEIAAHNFKQLQVPNIEVVNTDGLEHLNHIENIDVIYADPSRRNHQIKKVFFLEDCLPNIPENLGLLFKKCPVILVKTSPLLDIKKGLDSLQNVKEIHVVAVKNEVKELLWILTREFEGATVIQTANLLPENSHYFSFSLDEVSYTPEAYAEPKKYLYEPNKAILKSGGFHQLSKKYKVQKLQEHSHLYTADKLLDFPGRCFEITGVHSFQKKSIQKLNFKKANITVRNFPLTVQEFRKKFKITDGGEVYLFLTTLANTRKVIIECKKKEMHQNASL